MYYPYMKAIYCVDEILKMFEITKQTLRAWEKSGKFPKRRFITSKKPVWLEEDLEVWRKGLKITQK